MDGPCPVPAEARAVRPHRRGLGIRGPAVATASPRSSRSTTPSGIGSGTLDPTSPVGCRAGMTGDPIHLLAGPGVAAVAGDRRLASLRRGAAVQRLCRAVHAHLKGAGDLAGQRSRRSTLRSVRSFISTTTNGSSSDTVTARPERPTWRRWEQLRHDEQGQQRVQRIGTGTDP